jgi:hypothetical protein
MNASGLGDHFSACGRSWKEDGSGGADLRNKYSLL